MSWRDRLIGASYNGISFHVDSKHYDSGRSVDVHEFANRDIPYSEDLKRIAKRFDVTAYYVGPDYDLAMNALIKMCESSPQGLLILPTYGAQNVICEFVGGSESRQEGGYGVVDMTFVEKGKKPGPSQGGSFSDLSSQANSLSQVSMSSLDKLSGMIR